MREDSMRTTLDLPENLLEEVMKATKIKTKTKVIVADALSQACKVRSTTTLSADSSEFILAERIAA